MPDSPERLCGWINPEVLGRLPQHTAVFILIRFQQLLRAGRAVWLSWHHILGTGSVDTREGLADRFGSYRSQWESMICDHARPANEIVRFG